MASGAPWTSPCEDHVRGHLFERACFATPRASGRHLGAPAGRSSLKGRLTQRGGCPPITEISAGTATAPHSIVSLPLLAICSSPLYLPEISSLMIVYECSHYTPSPAA